MSDRGRGASAGSEPTAGADGARARVGLVAAWCAPALALPVALGAVLQEFGRPSVSLGLLVLSVAWCVLALGVREPGGVGSRVAFFAPPVLACGLCALRAIAPGVIAGWLSAPWWSIACVCLAAGGVAIAVAWRAFDPSRPAWWSCGIGAVFVLVVARTALVKDGVARAWDILCWAEGRDAALAQWDALSARFRDFQLELLTASLFGVSAAWTPVFRA